MGAGPAEHVPHEELERQPDLPAKIGNVDRIPDRSKVGPRARLSLVRVDVGISAAPGSATKPR